MTETTDNTQAMKTPKRWQDFSLAMKTRLIVRGIAQGLAQLALVIWAVRDLRRRSDDEINGNRKIWMLAAFAPPLGPIAYFLFGRKRRAST